MKNTVISFRTSLSYLYCKIYRVLDHVCLRLATFRENLLSSSGKVEGVSSDTKHKNFRRKLCNRSITTSINTILSHQNIYFVKLGHNLILINRRIILRGISRNSVSTLHTTHWLNHSFEMNKKTKPQFHQYFPFRGS